MARPLTSVQASIDPLTLNIGTGRGLSVLDVVQGFEQATDWPFRDRGTSTRPGGLPQNRPDRARPSGQRSPRTCAVMAGPCVNPGDIGTTHDRSWWAAGRRRSQPCTSAQTLGHATGARPQQSITLVTEAAQPLFRHGAGIDRRLYQRDELQSTCVSSGDRAGGSKQKSPTELMRLATVLPHSIGSA